VDGTEEFEDTENGGEQIAIAGAPRRRTLL
jgi:hypothetical protein